MFCQKWARPFRLSGLQRPSEFPLAEIVGFSSFVLHGRGQKPGCIGTQTFSKPSSAFKALIRLPRHPGAPNAIRLVAILADPLEQNKNNLNEANARILHGGERARLQRPLIGKLCHRRYPVPIGHCIEEAAMATRNISLTPEQDAFVESVVKAGVYQNASEAVRDALRVLQQRRREDALKLKALRLQIKAGAQAIARGDYVEIDDSELEGFLEELGSPAPNRARK
jgi:antitoxin ParD1/3/4